MRRLRPALIATAAVAVLFAAVFAVRTARTAPPPAQAPPPASVVAVAVVPADVPASLEAVGSLRAVREVMLAPEVAGRVVAIRFKGGEAVSAGAPLLQLYDAPERADRQAALAKARLTAAQLARYQALARTGTAPRQLLDERMAENAQANAEVAQIDARLAQKTVRAPFSGVLGIRRVNPGQYLNPGDEIATLTALDEL
ncbi:MAG: efflux RND transporter periplasmic adaptor subunit, partial [Phenylobacterium sp.]